MTQHCTAVVPQHPRIVVVVFPDGRGSLRLDDDLHEIRGVNQRDAQHKAIHLVTTLAAKPHARTVRVDAHSDQGRHQLLVSPDGTVAEAQAGWRPTTATPVPVVPAGHSTAEAVSLALPRQATRPISAGQLAAAGGATLLAAAVVATAAAGHVPRRQADIDLTSAGVSGTTASPTSTASSAAAPTATSTAVPTAAVAQTVRTATASPTTSSTTGASATAPTAAAAPMGRATSTPAPTTSAAAAVPAAAAPVAARATPTTAATAAASAGEPIRAVLDIEATGPVHATLTIEANGQVQVQQNPAREPASARSDAGTVPAITVRPQTPAVSAPTSTPEAPTSTATRSTPAPATSTASASPSETTATPTQNPTWSAVDEADLDEANDAMTRAMLNAAAGEEETPSTVATSAPAAGSSSTVAPAAQPTATQSAGTAKATSTPTLTPTSRPTSTGNTRNQQLAPVPDSKDGEQDETTAAAAPTTSNQAPTANPEAEATSTTGTEQRRSTRAAAAADSGGWLSGAAGDGVTDGALGNWRGKPVQIAGTWADDGEAQTQMWSLAPGEEFGNWDKPLDLAPGGMNDGDTWAAAASGAYDDQWRAGLTKAAEYRAGKGTTYIRPFHEFNGTWYPWSVAPGQEEDFKTAWARYRAIQQEVFPSAKLVYNPNVNSTGGLDWRKTWPGADQADVLGVDMYNGSPKRYDSAEAWASGLGATGDDGIPIGLNAYAAQANAWGVPLAVPEWSGRAEQGDDPAFITGIGTWFAQNAGTGPGQLLYEVMFNVDRNEDNFRLYNGTRMPQSAEAYREGFSKPAANGSGSSSTTTTTTAAATTDDASQDAPESEQRTSTAASRAVAADQGAAQDSEDGGDGDDGERSTQDQQALTSSTDGETDRTQEGIQDGGDVNATAGFEGGRDQDDSDDPT